MRSTLTPVAVAMDLPDPVHEVGRDDLRVKLSALAQLLHDFTKESGLTDREILHDLYHRLVDQLVDDD